MPPSTVTVGPPQPHWKVTDTARARAPECGDSGGGIAAVCNGRIPRHRSCEDSSLTRQIIADARVRTRNSAPPDVKWAQPSRVFCHAQRQQQEWSLFVADTNHARLGGGTDTRAAEAGVVCEHNISVKAFLAFKKTPATPGVGGDARVASKDGGAASTDRVRGPACSQEAPVQNASWLAHLDTPDKQQAHVEHLRAVYQGEAKSTQFVAHWTEDEQPDRADGDVFFHARDVISAIPDSWIDDQEECVFLQGERCAEVMQEESEDDWAPQVIDFAATVDDVYVEVSSPRRRMEEASYEDEEHVPVRMRSYEEKFELRLARRNRLIQANEELENTPEPAARKSRRVQFHQYEIVKDYDRSGDGHVIDEPLRVLYTKTTDGPRRNLPAASVTEVPFLRPAIAWMDRNGITVRAPHFTLVMKETRPTKNIDVDEGRAPGHEARVTRAVSGQASAAAPVPSSVNESSHILGRGAVFLSNRLHIHGGLPAGGQTMARIDVGADRKVLLKQQKKAAKAHQIELEKVSRHAEKMVRKGIGYYGPVSTKAR